MAIKVGRDQTGRAGEHYVAAELNRRGAYAAPWAGNLPDIDIVAMDGQKVRPAYIQVKTKGPKYKAWQLGQGLRLGWDLPKATEIECVSWGGCRDSDVCAKKRHKHVSLLPHSPHRDSTIDLKERKKTEGQEGYHWVFVALKHPPESPQYWIVADGDLRDLVRAGHTRYLKASGGHRNTTHNSLNSGMDENDLSPYRGKWSNLGLCLEDDPL